MPVTVRDVIDLPEVQHGRPQVICDDRLGDAIRWVHVSDVADLSGLLQGGELVLTTGEALVRSPAAYLRGLAAAGVVGVIVEIGETVAALSDSVGTAARDHGLALVALHRTVRFVEVTEAVHRRIVAEQYDAVAFDRAVHETFTDLSMRRASMGGIVDAASRMLDQPVVLEDLAHQVLASSSGSQTDIAGVLADWERRSRHHPDSGVVSEGWTAAVVGPRGETWGRLVVPREVAAPARTLRVLERAAVALALHRMIERDRTGLHQKAQSGLIDDVIEARVTGENEIAARAHALGVGRAAVYHPMVIRLNRSVPDTDPVSAQRRNVQQLDAVSHAIRTAGHTALSTIRREGEVDAVIALREARAGADHVLTDVANRVRAVVTRVGGVVGCTVAVGDSEPRIGDAIGSLPAVAHVAEVAEAMEGVSRAFYRATDVRLRGLLALLRDDPRVQAFAESELRTLIASQPQLLSVLRAYLQVNGNKVALARRLHISRPVLYKRLRTIEEVGGIDLADPESLVSLQVALMVHDAQRAGAAAG
ncbi:PucR family transcriptional regulator [Williamsia sterculiae]|uniref:Purine catabolism regulatory protein n=1 Tax=Williamsia sterculiae TaxID=1344003 RepID=A0A1N7EPV8_9NOCA|nr:PucR family transcriptional regulator [Williamsia sterculiae]SIR90069.1 purine catabolism regulatory protein [Williamsia sterculiae]